MAEHFNDWDLQAVVRSCGSVAHPEPAAAAPRADQPDAAPEPVPAPRRDEAPAARATPTTVPVRRQGRASPPAAKAAALLYDLEYLDLDHRPFLLPAAPSPSPSPGPRAGAGGREREVMISFPAAAAASTSGTQQRASPPGRKPGARTSRPKRRYRTGRPVQHRTVVVEPAEEGGAMI
jgi:WRKY transcription factor 22